MFLFVNFNNVNAENVGIPEWVLIVYDFWNDDLISDEDLESMLVYLENRDIIEFDIHYGNNHILNLLLNIPEKITI